MKELKAKNGKVLAKKVSENEIWVTTAVTAPDNVSLEDWLEFDSQEQAYEQFGIEEEQE